MTLAANIRHVSGHCWKGFQGQRSKVKVITKPVNL